MVRSPRYTLHEVSKRLELSESALRSAVARGYLPVVRHLGHVFVTEEGLTEFVRWRNR